ncbi:MAG TPA: hypothetical protein DDW50_06830 [Firmicutes bacterium]|nr:hypothetical protein [Bacillota bacterium]
MKNHKMVGITLMLVLAVAMNGCNGNGGNKNRPAPTRPRASENRAVKRSGPWSQPQFPGTHQGRR